MANLKNTVISDTVFRLPVGNTSQRLSDDSGKVRFNTDINATEFYDQNSANWKKVEARGVKATGGDVFDTVSDGRAYRVHVFNNVGTYNFEIEEPGEVDVLLVGGGGGGGATIGGGGGAGGFVYKESLFVSPQTYSITVGDGGLGGYEYSYTTNENSESGLPGNDTTAFGFTALGGGGGSGWDNGPTPTEGGSGGGGSAAVDDRNDPDRAGQAGIQPGTNPTADIDAGNDGADGDDGTIRAGGGGGGAGAPGEVGRADNKVGNGGIGLAIDITGVSRFYAGGGGGGDDDNGPNPNPGGFGGLGGGGRGGIDGGASTDPRVQGTPGGKGTGGGGGSGSYTGTNDNDDRIGGNGGSGVVIVRYRKESLQAEDDKSMIKDGLVFDLDPTNPATYNGRNHDFVNSLSDSQFYNITGTFENDATIVHPQSDAAYFEFDGSSDRLDFGNPQIVRNIAGTDQITVSVWAYFYAYGGGGQSYIVMTTYGDPWLWLLENPDQQFTFRIDLNGSDTKLKDPNTHNLNQWYNIVGVYNGSTQYLYVDGQEVNSQSASGPLDDPNRTLKVATYRGTNYNLNGRIGQLLVYERALSADEVLQNYNAVKWRYNS